MSGQRKYPNLKAPTRPGGPYLAYLAIPHALQHLFEGRKFFQASTQEKNQAKAFAIAQPLVAGWRDRLEAARKQAADPFKVEVQRLTARFQRLSGQGRKAGELFGAGMWSSVDEEAGEVWTGLIQLIEGRLSEKVHDPVATTSTPFLTHIGAWEAATRYSGQQFKTALSHINDFASAVPQTLETLISDHVQVWVDGRLASGDAENTVRNRLYSVKNYWKWMTQRGLAPKTSNPFEGIEVRGHQSSVEKARTAPVRFEPCEVVKLWTKAADDQALYAMIRIGAFSGARREAIAQLKTSAIFFDAPVPYFHIEGDKTPAGNRQVPIHPVIMDEMKALAKNADKDGFLIHSTAKGEKRGDAIGKRFSKLKTAMGFDGRRDFHSIRRTVAHLFEAAHCPEGVAQDIIGHKKKSLTYGTYSGITTLALKKEWIERAIKYPASVTA